MIRVDSQQPFHTKIGDFIRTGVVGDGSCFFHSVLYSCTPEYRKLTIPERMCLVEDLRRLISKEVTVDIWLSLGNGEVAKLAYQTHLARILDKYDLGSYIKNDYIPRVLQKYGYIDATCNIDDPRLEKMISSEYNHFKTTLLQKSREAIESAYSEFIKNVESTNILWMSI